MANAAKRGDSDTACTIGCCTYTPDTITSVPAKTVFFNGEAPIVDGDVIDTAEPFTWNCPPSPPNCPPLTRTIIANSSTVFINNRRVAVIGDKTHPQRTITGSGHANIRIG